MYYCIHCTVAKSHTEHTAFGEKATELLLRPVPVGSHRNGFRDLGSTTVAFRWHAESRQ